jgi:hypothetical protein
LTELIDDDINDDNVDDHNNLDDDIDDNDVHNSANNLGNNDDANNSANMTEENTTETFDLDLEHLIITILKGNKDDRVGQALNNGGIYSWEDFILFSSDDTEYLTYKDGNENRELPILTQKRFKYAIFYYKWLKQDNVSKS